MVVLLLNVCHFCSRLNKCKTLKKILAKMKEHLKVFEANLEEVSLLCCHKPKGVLHQEARCAKL